MEVLTELVYKGQKFSVEAFVAPNGKIFNEKKFKHLTGTSQIFEFKVDEARILSFFVIGRRIILTHGFSKRTNKTPLYEIERAEIIRYEFLRRIKDGKN